MTFEDSVTLDAPAGEVWDLLLDVNRFSACMPGIEEVEQVDERTFRGKIQAEVGPMSGQFAFKARITDSRPPTELAADVEGTDSVTKSRLNAHMGMNLTALSDSRTELAYRTQVEVHGRLAILGDMLLRATAGLLLEEFIKRLRRQLEHSHPA
jgi:carbon monoxide dehydrogenase subunit G